MKVLFYLVLWFHFQTVSSAKSCLMHLLQDFCPCNLLYLHFVSLFICEVPPKVVWNFQDISDQMIVPWYEFHDQAKIWDSFLEGIARNYEPFWWTKVKWGLHVNSMQTSGVLVQFEIRKKKWQASFFFFFIILLLLSFWISSKIKTKQILSLVPKSSNTKRTEKSHPLFISQCH